MPKKLTPFDRAMRELDRAIKARRRKLPDSILDENFGSSGIEDMSEEDFDRQYAEPLDRELRAAGFKVPASMKEDRES